MSNLYKVFANDYLDELDFSEDALYEMYVYESTGGKCCNTNGYYHGKRLLNLTVSMWKEDIKIGLLFKYELYNDNKFPHWFLDSIFK